MQKSQARFQKKQIIELSVIFTLLLPILSILVLKKIKVIDSLSMENKEERRWPLLFVVGWNYILFNLLVTIQAHYLIIRLILGAMLILFIAIIISNFWKISLHMLGIGGLVGVFCALYLGRARRVGFVARSCLSFVFLVAF